MKLFSTQPLNSRQKSNSFFLAVLFLVTLIFTFYTDPRNVSFLSCSFKNITGHNCPTCGLSRSFYACANLNFSEAFAYHLLGPVFYFSIIIMFLKSTTEIITNNKIQLATHPAIAKIFLTVLLLTWLIFWITNF
jgi:Protein of unknown function (DUF2752)